MAGINKVIIVGNLGRDPEMRYTQNGTPVTSFSVAVSRNWKTPDGESREETEWFNVECWSKLAEIANQYLAKGKQVFIEGRLRTDSWDDKTTGEKKYRTKVVANEMQMLGQRGEAPGSGTNGDNDDFGASRPATSGSTDNYELDNMPF